MLFAAKDVTWATTSRKFQT